MIATCKQIAELATIWAEGGLTSVDRHAFDDHLLGCDGCRTYVRQLEATRAALARLPAPEIPPALEQTILASFDAWAASGAGTVRPQARASRWFSPLPALASLAVVTLLVTFARARSQTPDDWLIGTVLAAAALAFAVMAGRFALGVVVAAVAAAVAAALTSGRAGAMEAGTGVECLALELVAAAAVGGAAWLGTRWGSRAAVRHALAAGSVAGALAADAALQITCQAHGALSHLLVFHLGGVLIVAGVAVALVRSARAPARS